MNFESYSSVDMKREKKISLEKIKVYKMQKILVYI
jgi:hypothetical protein